MGFELAATPTAGLDEIAGVFLFWFTITAGDGLAVAGIAGAWWIWRVGTVGATGALLSIAGFIGPVEWAATGTAWTTGDVVACRIWRDGTIGPPGTLLSTAFALENAVKLDTGNIFREVLTSWGSAPSSELAIFDA